MSRAALSAMFCAVAVALCVTCAWAHGLNTAVSEGRAVIVTVSFEDGSPMAFESCEVLPPGDRPPLQVGRTDRLGRVIFAPDRAGAWRVRVTAEDGHGVVVPVDVDEEMVAAPATGSGGGRAGKLVTGVGVLLGIFGILAMAMARGRGLGRA